MIHTSNLLFCLAWYHWGWHLFIKIQPFLWLFAELGVIQKLSSWFMFHREVQEGVYFNCRQSILYLLYQMELGRILDLSKNFIICKQLKGNIASKTIHQWRSFPNILLHLIFNLFQVSLTFWNSFVYRPVFYPQSFGEDC